MAMKPNIQQQLNYTRIAEAIDYIKTHFKEQPKLEEVASKVHLSPFHFQRLFTDWVGISPKKFLQYTSIEYAKSLLQHNTLSVFEATVETGLSSTSRMHDLFVQIEGMTPGEFRNGGAALEINYSVAASPFGQIVIASTKKGICRLTFADDANSAVNQLRAQFPNAAFMDKEVEWHRNAYNVFHGADHNVANIKLHLKGSPFQLQVWKALLSIPAGRLATYGKVADKIGNPRASRAIGTAIGHNPVAYLIPCHRVIRASGESGGYYWGTQRKQLMIGWEGAQFNPEHFNETEIDEAATIQTR
jgi:AraC family transcriptional regulator of adaptative response/methylated-DNA-[protein]-cysteine methyltransferase